MKKVAKLFIEVDGKFIRSDGFLSDPVNTKRVINISKLTDDFFEAKNFYFYPEDVAATKNAFPSARLIEYSFDLTYVKTVKPR